MIVNGKIKEPTCHVIVKWTLNAYSKLKEKPEIIKNAWWKEPFSYFQIQSENIRPEEEQSFEMLQQELEKAQQEVEEREAALLEEQLKNVLNEICNELKTVAI